MARVRVAPLGPVRVGLDHCERGHDQHRPEVITAAGGVRVEVHAAPAICPKQPLPCAVRHLNDRLVGDVVEYLSDGSMMFFWYPDGDWSSASAYLD